MSVPLPLLTRLLSLFLISSFYLPAMAIPGFEPDGRGAGYPDHSHGRTIDRPSLRAQRVETGKVILDGRLVEQAWLGAEAGRGFTQMEPERGELPSEDTVFKVLYDEEAFYFGVACFESDPERIASTLSRRDNMDGSDIISIYVDPYFDRSSGYNFRVNPHGVVQDAFLTEPFNRDGNWDAVWDCATHRDERGWYAEIRIPFSSVRYRGGPSMTWGLQVYRWMHARGEDTGWVHWDRDQGGFISNFGTLTGLDGVKPPRQIEILPYSVTGATDLRPDDSVDDWESSANFGADLKYGITPNLTLNATFQPDFGQVEADPSQLNLSPYEIRYEEKRPFFIEGASFFRHPDFALFYSRRIGTGDENSRIRFAGKLTGKTSAGVSVAGLVAATDITGDGQAHNAFLSGDNPSYFAVGRFGKEFAEGDHRVNLMQTAVIRNWTTDDPGEGLRDGYTSGLDFDLNFDERSYNLEGSFVGSVVDYKSVEGDPAFEHDPIYGNAGSMSFRKQAGTWRWGMHGSWESDKLDLNDMGILREPDEVQSGTWISYQYNSDGEESWFNQGNWNMSINRGWFYAGRHKADEDAPGETLWAYGKGHPQNLGADFNTWWQLSNFWDFHAGMWRGAEGISRGMTRTYDGERGPLMRHPASTSVWAGMGSDWRKDWRMNLNGSYSRNDRGGWGANVNGRFYLRPSARMSASLSSSYSQTHSLAQWVGNFSVLDDEGLPTGGVGIGGVSYVFAELEMKTLDFTLRSSFLFNRDQSLDLYLQPFITAGDFSNPRELMEPNSFWLNSYEADGFEVSEEDFEYGAVNLNLVYRWEYRPGSTFYLVWSHSRYNYRTGYDVPGELDNGLAMSTMVDNVAENRLMAKLNYWIAL